MKLFSFKDRSFMISITFGIILIIIFVTIIIISLNKNNTGNKQANIAPPVQNNISVKQVVPDEPETLGGGIPHTFLVYFSKHISLESLNISLTYTDITQDNPQVNQVKIYSSMLGANVIAVKTVDPIKERSEYYLKITDKETNKILSSTSYLSGDIQPTKIPTNDQTLKSFLPYETNNYTLEYNASQNLYIFEFKYDPSLSENITQQYNDAKAAAIQFIESKGININSITIQYKSS